MNRVTGILEDIFYLNNTSCLSRLKYFTCSILVKIICLLFIASVVYIYKMNNNSIILFILVISLLLYADFNLTAKRLRDVGVPFPYWISSLIFILFTTYLAGFDHQIIRWLVITVSMIPYILPTGMIKKRENTDENTQLLREKSLSFPPALLPDFTQRTNKAVFIKNPHYDFLLLYTRLT